MLFMQHWGLLELVGQVRHRNTFLLVIRPSSGMRRHYFRHRTVFLLAELRQDIVVEAQIVHRLFGLQLVHQGTWTKLMRIGVAENQESGVTEPVRHPLGTAVQTGVNQLDIVHDTIRFEDGDVIRGVACALTADIYGFALEVFD